MSADEGTTAAAPPPAFAVSMARAAAGAAFFSLPLLMTMEMWWLGFTMDSGRLALFVALSVPLVVGLDHYSGFESTARWRDDLLDGLVAYAVGVAVAITLLGVFGVVRPADPIRETVGKVALQAVPGALGAVLASTQFGGAGTREERRKSSAGYAAEVFFMAAGAVYFAFNVAPTEEMVVIACRITHWHGVGIGLLSLVARHVLSFPHASLAVRFTAVGYAVSLIVSGFVLWSFGRFDGVPLDQRVLDAVVLALPASLGASAARIVL
jgi:putative integral membrane protein (TIGR02587 family)